jgi:hypothetical protein
LPSSPSIKTPPAGSLDNLKERSHINSQNIVEGDTVGIFYDSDARNVTFYKNKIPVEKKIFQVEKMKLTIDLGDAPDGRYCVLSHCYIFRFC